MTAEGAAEGPVVVKVVQDAAAVETPILGVAPAVREVGAAAGHTHFEIDNLGGGTLAWTAQVVETGEWLIDFVFTHSLLRICARLLGGTTRFLLILAIASDHR